MPVGVVLVEVGVEEGVEVREGVFYGLKKMILRKGKCRTRTSLITFEHLSQPPVITVGVVFCSVVVPVNTEIIKLEIIKMEITKLGTKIRVGDER